MDDLATEGRWAIGYGALARRFSVALMLVGLVGAANASSAAASGWSIQTTPQPAGATDSELNGVSCTSASVCTAVGDYYAGSTDVALAERWNGATWSIQTVPTPNGAKASLLRGVSCTSASACTAVGHYYNATTDVALAERWNGTKWSVQTIPNPAGATNIDLDGVSCSSESACIAVGHYDIATVQVTLAERWNGTKWSIQTTPNPVGATDSVLRSVACTSESACTAVGFYFNGTFDVALAERWNGATWSIQTTPDDARLPGSELDGVSCTSGSACTAVGLGLGSNSSPGATLAERWNGTNWSIQTTPSPNGSTTSLLASVACTSNSACTAVGNGYTGTTYTTVAGAWNGTKWSMQKTPAGATGGKLYGVSCNGACTAVGSYTDSSGFGVMLAERWSAG